MNIPVRLYRRAKDGAIVETLEPGETGSLLYGAGAALVDSVAEASGVSAYLRQRASTKAVEQSEVEDKAVDQEEVEDKGITPDRPRPGARRG
jgi:hypothetical protein